MPPHKNNKTAIIKEREQNKTKKQKQGRQKHQSIRKQKIAITKENQNKAKRTKKHYPLPYTFMEDTVRHNITQMISVIKAYITCLLVIMIMEPTP